MGDILKQGEVTYEKLDLLMKEGSYEEMADKCSDMVYEYALLESQVLKVSAPSKYKGSHIFMKKSIVELHTSVESICRGIKERSYDTISQGIELNREALKTMIEGQDILFTESKNKSLLEKIFTNSYQGLSQ